MAERAHPKDFAKPGSWRFRLRRGFIPWISRVKSSPYYDEFIYRYEWVNGLVHQKRVLEIPCGMGWGTSIMTNASFVVGLDISAEAIEEARSKYPESGEFKVGDMNSLDYPDESFDTVVCLEGIEHVPIKVADAFLKEANRVLRSEGSLLISSPHAKNGIHSGNPYHIHEYPPDEIQEKLELGFNVINSHTREVDKMIVTYFECKKL